MAISLNKLISVAPSVITATGNAIDLNGLILSDNDYLPVGKVLSFAGPDTVRDKFGSSSDEFSAASIYFQGVKNCTSTPSKLLFARFNRDDSKAFLVSNNLNMTLSKLKTLTGEIHITVDGVQKSADVDLSTITSFLNAADVIEKALKDVSVNYNSLTKQFKISSVGANADDTSISFATGTLAQALCLNEEAGAHISSGVGAVSAEALFKTILASNMNWYSFTTLFECTKEQHLDLSAWVTSQNHRYNYVAWTTECNALIADNQSTLLYELEKIHNYSDVTPLYVKEMNKAANVLGYYASLDFNRERGRVPLHYRALDGMKADVTSNADYDGLTSNGYNFYGAYAANADSYSIWQSGRVLGDHMWADAHAAQVWLNANLQKVTVTTLMQNLTIPYNNIGRELFAAPLIGVMEKFKLWGGCNAGTDLDETQKLAINQITGFDITPTLYAKGYYIYISPFTASMRAQRSSPSIFAIYTDGGAFRTIEIDSIEVQ